jgi:hypothetical protein
MLLEQAEELCLVDDYDERLSLGCSDADMLHNRVRVVCQPATYTWGNNKIEPL